MTFTSRDAAALVAEGRAEEYAAGVIEHLAARLAMVAEELARDDLAVAGVDAEVAQVLAAAVQREVRARLDGHQTIRQRPRLTLVPRLNPKA